MKIVAVSDLHGTLPTIPECDLLLIAGDVCPVRDHRIMRQASWLHREFRDWLAAAPARQIVGIAGNHDFIFERAPKLIPANLPWTYLQDSGLCLGDLNIWGTPWQPVFGDWAFNADADRRERYWRLIPDDTDILVVHGPPHGLGDAVPPHGEHVGCRALAYRILTLPRLRLVVYGHIHEGRGVYELGQVTCVNATLLDGAYRPVYAPVVLADGPDGGWKVLAS